MSKDNGTLMEHVKPIPGMAEDVLEAVRKGADKAKKAIIARRTPWWQKPKFYIPASIAAIAMVIARFGGRNQT